MSLYKTFFSAVIKQPYINICTPLGVARPVDDTFFFPSLESFHVLHCLEPSQQNDKYPCVQIKIPPPDISKEDHHGLLHLPRISHPSVPVEAQFHC